MDPSYSNPAFGAGAGGQPQQPVFGAGGAQVPISSGTGDIVLASEKKSRKGVIIALIVAVLIIGGLFAAVFLMRGGDNGVSGDAKLAFNKYANYLLYGEDSDKSLEGEYNDNDLGKLYEILNEEDNNAISVYSDRLSTLWQDFSNKSNNFAIADGVTRDEYGDRVNFMVTFLNKASDINYDKIFSLAQTRASGDVNSVINSYFITFKKFDFEDAKDYVDNGQLFYQKVVEITEKMKEQGCNFESGDGCNDELFDEGEEALMEYSSGMSIAIDDVRQYLVENCWNANKIINGGKA